MPNALPWKEVLEGIEQALAQVEAAAAARARELEELALPVPLAPDSAWEARLRGWDALVAKLPEAAEEAQRECRDTEALLCREEEALRAWLAAAQGVQQRLAAWDAKYKPGRRHTMTPG